jgi:transcriptional regulator with XRE-family HTH domain
MRWQASERTGAAIRKLRLARGWTLAELSAESGLPLSTLSRVELGQNALNYDKLMRLCQALEVDVGNLMARQADSATIASGRRSVVRAGEGEPVALGPHSGRRAGAELLDKVFTPTILDVVATSLPDHGAMSVLDGEAYVLILAGQVVLHSQLYAPLPLGPGDGVYFDGRAPHALLAAEAAGARVLMVVTGDQPTKP